VLMRRGAARVRLSLRPGRYEVQALLPSGERAHRVSAAVSAEGLLSFVCETAAGETAVYLYEIVRHPGLVVSVE